MSPVLRWSLPLLLVACQRAPELTGVQPGHVVAGDVIAVSGRHLAEGARLELVREGAESVPLGNTVRVGDQLSAALPETVAPGLWSVRVTSGEAVLNLEDALRIDEVSALSVCASDVVSNTRVSLVRGEVRIERFTDAAHPEVDVVRIDDVAHVELDSPDAEAPCSVVWLRLTDGRRVAFDQSRTLPLRSRAQSLATSLQRSLVSLQHQADVPAADAD